MSIIVIIGVVWLCLPLLALFEGVRIGADTRPPAAPAKRDDYSTYV